MIDFSNFLFTTTGAFAIWLFKGLKGPFDNEMVRIDERFTAKGLIRYFLGFAIWIAILFIVTVLLI